MTTGTPRDRRVSLLVLLVLGAIVVWAGYLFVVTKYVPAADRGIFGDMFGGVAALFSALAFAGLLYAIFLQRDELALQRKELELTREELKGQKDQLEAQTKALNEQNAHQVLLSLFSDYKSPQMFLCVKSLWAFRRENGSDFVQQYENIRKRDDDELLRLSPDERIPAVLGTLHFQRNLVKNFYGFLSSLYHLGIIRSEVLYTYWDKADLEIIPQILIPIERQLGKALGKEDAFVEAALSELQRLYDDAPDMRQPTA